MSRRWFDKRKAGKVSQHQLRCHLQYESVYVPAFRRRYLYRQYFCIVVSYIHWKSPRYRQQKKLKIQSFSVFWWHTFFFSSLIMGKRVGVVWLRGDGFIDRIWKKYVGGWWDEGSTEWKLFDLLSDLKVFWNEHILYYCLLYSY